LGERESSGAHTRHIIVDKEGKHVAYDVPDFTPEDFDIPVTLDIMRTLVRYNLRIPIGFIIARRHILFEAGSYVATKKGAETGVIYTSQTQVEIVRNGKQRKVGINLNFASKCLIKAKENFAFFPDVIICNYLG